MSTPCKLLVATASSASGGHGRNQLTVQWLISEGKTRARPRKPSPTGDIARHTWVLATHLGTTVVSKERRAEAAAPASAPVPAPVPAPASAPVPAPMVAPELNVLVKRGDEEGVVRAALLSASCSSVEKRLATWPTLSKLLMSSRYASSWICMSVRRKTTGLHWTAAMRRNAWTSSRQLLRLYDLDTLIVKRLMPIVNAASRAMDCRPEPPTPKSRMWPRGAASTRLTLQMCSHA
mmetsp:Transcript_34508/g.68723  ORF Transcript_34508/g.68723 Transcript_34508/m.68723 type:complete len:235 (-) Transcript_34508:827-1531(-)